MLKVFQNKVLRQIFGPKSHKVAGGGGNFIKRLLNIFRNNTFIYILLLLTAIGLSPGGSSPTLVQTKIKIHKTTTKHKKT